MPAVDDAVLVNAHRPMLQESRLSLIWTLIAETILLLDFS
jgi:hypothetical protein